MMNSLMKSGLLVLLLTLAAGVYADDSANTKETPTNLELGRQLYLEGMLPSGKTISGRVRGDIGLSGKQVICGTCHRKSGMGSSEGDQVIPALAGSMLFKPLRLPTSSNPLAPTQRPAYTDETLKRAIRDGIDSNGLPLDPLMPRYPLSDHELDLVIGYLKSLSVEWSPGVDGKEIHFATIVAGDVSAADRKALKDVMRVYVEQKNSESRHETYRAENAPWHKKWLFEPYRKWVMHVWELQGDSASWGEQLKAHYAEQPVFAVLSGIGEGSWKPVHDFCQAQQVPCLFPTTSLPVIQEDDFYPIYLSKGMALEGELVNLHLQSGQSTAPLMQVYRQGNLKAETAAYGLIGARGEKAVNTLVWEKESSSPSAQFWESLLQKQADTRLVLWMESEQLINLWPVLEKSQAWSRVYLSSTLFGADGHSIPPPLRDRVFLTRTQELPSRTARLLLRSTGWLKAKKIYAPEALDVQANAYLALKVAGDALTHIRSYFFRDYLIERIEHTVDNVPYTSVYPRISMAPEQRFAAKGGYITQFASNAGAKLEAVTDWVIPQ